MMKCPDCGKAMTMWGGLGCCDNCDLAVMGNNGDSVIRSPGAAKSMRDSVTRHLKVMKEAERNLIIGQNYEMAD